VAAGEEQAVRSKASVERGLLLFPALLLVTAVVGLPALRVLALSFTRVELDGGITTHWNGLASYGRLWQDGRWWVALRNTALFVTASVALETALGIAFALALHRSRARKALRAIVLVPWALPTAVMSLAWAWIFNDSFGVLNDLLRRLGLLAAPIAWLGEPATAMLAMVLAEAWKTTPFVALVVLAGLQGISEDVIDAARVDGLTAGQRLRRVVLPLLAPSILVAVVFRVVQACGAFDVVYVMTGGGPGGSTETVSLYAFQNYFRYLDFGYASAVAIQGMMFAAATAIAIVWLGRRSQGTA
jgi:multiple sugar transport system permease protein